MNNLMCFEGHQVEIIKENDEWLFEIYSTGKALGYCKWNGKRTYCTPSKDRIDTVIKNAEITPVVHGVRQYFIESQLYDFMLEAKTEKVKPFRKWLVNEVLPAINHTGTYSVEKEPKQLKLEEKPYEYIPKLYKGEPVVTAADLEHFTGINRSNFSYYRKKYARRFQIGVDFWYLNGEVLREFKEENRINPLTNCLIVYSKSGVMKLSKVMSGVPAELPCLCVKEQENKKEDYYWSRNDMHDFFDKTKELITVVQVIMELIDRYNTPLEHKRYMDSLGRFIQELNNRLLTIKTFSLYDMNGECEIMELKKEKTIPEQEKYLESLKGQFNPSKDIALNFKEVNKDKIVTLF